MDRDIFIRAVVTGVILCLIETSFDGSGSGKKFANRIVEKILEKLAERAVDDAEKKRIDRVAGPIVAEDRPGSPSALGLTFKNACKVPLRLAVFTQDTTLGPRGSRYTIEPDSERTFRVGCKKGETVSYGAEAIGEDKVWGAGLSDDRSCEHCHQICDGRMLAYVLGN